jgi:hypothetical protein
MKAAGEKWGFDGSGKYAHRGNHIISHKSRFLSSLLKSSSELSQQNDLQKTPLTLFC